MARSFPGIPQAWRYIKERDFSILEFRIGSCKQVPIFYNPRAGLEHKSQKGNARQQCPGLHIF
jgi:hypothetical protein